MRRVILLACVLHSGCDETDPSDDGMAGDALDPEEVKAMADDYASFERINAMPSTSRHGNASTVNWWVPSADAEAFRTLDPAAPSEVGFEVGMLVVKEHLDADGAADGYTMMVKGPEGTNPEAADWWFARVTPAGELAESGAVGFCMNCHRTVEASDWLYGVPLDNRR